MSIQTKGAKTPPAAAEKIEDLAPPNPEVRAEEAERIKGAAYRPTHALGNEASNDLGPDNIQKKS
jgi:hypothetical protein